MKLAISALLLGSASAYTVPPMAVAAKKAAPKAKVRLKIIFLLLAFCLSNTKLFSLRF